MNTDSELNFDCNVYLFCKKWPYNNTVLSQGYVPYDVGVAEWGPTQTESSAGWKANINNSL